MTEVHLEAGRGDSCSYYIQLTEKSKRSTKNSLEKQNDNCFLFLLLLLLFLFLFLLLLLLFLLLTTTVVALIFFAADFRYLSSN